MTALVPLGKMWDRAQRAREESDTAYFYDLLFLGEFTVKLVTAGMLAALASERENHRYRLEFNLVRANGIGDWSQALDELLTGPPAQSLLTDARPEHRDLTKRWGPEEDSWQYEATALLHEACQLADVGLDVPPAKLALRHWMTWFPALRNRTRAHGAPTGTRCAAVSAPLERSLEMLTSSLLILNRPWAFMRRTMADKYHVVELGEPSEVWRPYKTEKGHRLSDCVHVWFGSPRAVHLVDTTVDLDEFFVANGDYRDNGTSESLSYITDSKRRADVSQYRLPPGSLPPSQTDARPTLELRGEGFTDVPPPSQDYVVRSRLEGELADVLVDKERFPVVTLVGSGGSGKTSTALQVVNELVQSGDFFASLWFSARDIDLLNEGPKVVKPQVLSVEEIAEQFAERMNPERRETEGFDATQYLAESLADGSDDARILFVIDNFETIRNPLDVYGWLSNAVRLPNKVLLTTRFREFKADYPVEVGRMSDEEFSQLVESTAAKLGIRDRLTSGYLRELHEESDGHPYIAKVLLGEVALVGGEPSVKRVLASKDDILDALFDRTFGMLSKPAQRVFLTVCNWRSHIPRLALEAALLRPANERIDVGHAIETLGRSSLIELSTSETDGQEWLSLPLAAYLFGQRKLIVSPMRIAIEADTEVLRAFGAAKGSDLVHGVGPAVNRLVQRIGERLAESEDAAALRSVLEYVAGKYPPAWLQIADLVEVVDNEALPTGADAVRRYLEAYPNDPEGWQRLARACRVDGDALGEMNARLQLSVLPDAPYEAVSEAATRFNYLMAERVLDVDSDEKRVMAERLRDLMEARVAEADATDRSRLAWLSLHLGDAAQARVHTEAGLSLDAGNQHCLRLQATLGSP